MGINYLEKIQTPTLPSLFGAMLAGVDYVLMGAGIPRAIPGVLDRLVNGDPVELSLNVLGADREDKFVTRFDPMKFTGNDIPWLERPKFVAIVASSTLASMLVRKARGRVDGFVVEGPTAGGHNAPPRGQQRYNDRGEPIYGTRDAVDLDAIGSLGLPFWLAGSYGSPKQVLSAIEAGATGVQVGTAFAFCEESGLRRDIRESVVQMCRNGELDVVTDPHASPTGFPFKVLQLNGSISDRSVYERRERVCDLGFLRQGYRKEDGTIGWRCPGERHASFLHKGGKLEDTEGRKCVCNGLLSAVGLGQRRRDGQRSRPLPPPNRRGSSAAPRSGDPDSPPARRRARRCPASFRAPPRGRDPGAEQGLWRRDSGPRNDPPPGRRVAPDGPPAYRSRRESVGSGAG